jgi:hypothetical protein
LSRNRRHRRKSIGWHLLEINRLAPEVAVAYDLRIAEQSAAKKIAKEVSPRVG